MLGHHPFVALAYHPLEESASGAEDAFGEQQAWLAESIQKPLKEHPPSPKGLPKQRSPFQVEQVEKDIGDRLLLTGALYFERGRQLMPGQHGPEVRDTVFKDYKFSVHDSIQRKPAKHV
jgi:hypothetical protein